MRSAPHQHAGRTWGRLHGRRGRVSPPICHDLRSWAAATPAADYLVLDPPTTATRPLPRTVETDVDSSFLPLCSFPVPERALVKIPYGRVCGSTGLVGLPTGEIAGELVALTPAGQRTMLESLPDYHRPFPAKSVVKAGHYYPVLGLGADHYYHWTHDIVTRMRGIGERLPADTMLIVPARMRPFQVETLSLVGLDDHERIPIGESEQWQLENLWIVTPVQKTQIDTPEPYRWLRDAVMHRYGVRVSAPTKRLYLTRRADRHWRIVNEAAVQRLLSSYGFETISPAELSFREQVELFAQAGVIVGTGAGLTNMVFSPPGTRILQFQEPERIVHALWVMAVALGFEYHYVMGESVPNPGGKNADIFMPIGKLQDALAALTAPAA